MKRRKEKKIKKLKKWVKGSTKSEQRGEYIIKKEKFSSLSLTRTVALNK